MKQEKIAQYKKRETSRIIGEEETMREEGKKLLSPKGAIVFPSTREHATALTAV